MVLVAVRILATITFLYSKLGRQCATELPAKSSTQSYQAETTEIRLTQAQQENVPRKSSELSKKSSSKNMNRAHAVHVKKRPELGKDTRENLKEYEGRSLVISKNKTPVTADDWAVERTQNDYAIEANSDGVQKVAAQKVAQSEAMGKKKLHQESANVGTSGWTKCKRKFWKAHGSVYDFCYKAFETTKEIGGLAPFQSKSPDLDVHVDANPAPLPEKLPRLRMNMASSSKVLAVANSIQNPAVVSHPSEHESTPSEKAQLRKHSV